VVNVPAGTYTIRGSLTVPPNCELRGANDYPYRTWGNTNGTNQVISLLWALSVLRVKSYAPLCALHWGSFSNVKSYDHVLGLCMAGRDLQHNIRQMRRLIGVRVEWVVDCM
jgi:hypothetical protein